MNHKHKIAGLLLLGGLASACSSSSGGHSAAAGSAEGKVVHVWVRSATSAVSQQMVKDFNASHSNLRVQMTQVQPQQSVSKLATAIRAGSPPDAFGIEDTNISDFAKQGTALDLTSRIKSLPFEAALSKGHLSVATYQGRQYGVPYISDLSVLWYNRKLFQQAGLDPNSPPTNFAQMVADARKVNALGNGVHGFTFGGNCPGCSGFTYLPMVWATGQRLIDGSVPHQTANVENNAPLRATLQMYRTMWSEHLVPAANATENGATWGQDFMAGKIGIFPGGVGSVVGRTDSPILKDIAAAPLPGPGGGFSTFDGGDDFMIPKGSKNPDGAWEFIKFVLQTQEQQKYPALGFTPVRSDVLTPALAKQYPFQTVALKALKNGYCPSSFGFNTIFVAPNGPTWTMFQRAVFKGDVDGALRQGQTDLEQSLRQFGDAS